jgi:hypothetical protein
MARLQADKITLTEHQEKILRQMQTGTHTPMHLKKRSEIILLSNQGHANNAIERIMGVHGETVTLWRNRYALAETELAKLEADMPRKLRSGIEKTIDLFRILISPDYGVFSILRRHENPSVPIGTGGSGSFPFGKTRGS